jgi:hypothetical protein
MDEGMDMSRWPRAPYVIAAAIAVVLVTVFTLYGLLSNEPAQQKPSTPATKAEMMAPQPVRYLSGSSIIVRAES